MVDRGSWRWGDRGSWILARDRGSGHGVDPGSWLVALGGSWILDLGTEWIVDRGSWRWVDSGSWIVARLDAETPIYIINYMIKQRFRGPRRFPTIWFRIVDRGMGWLGSWIVALGGSWIVDRGSEAQRSTFGRKNVNLHNKLHNIAWISGAPGFSHNLASDRG